MNSEVRFRLNRGCKVAREVTMLVNKPRVTMPHNHHQHEEELKDDMDMMVAGGGATVIEYTVTQPR
jgi:hypothetical protein